MLLRRMATSVREKKKSGDKKKKQAESDVIERKKQNFLYFKVTAAPSCTVCGKTGRTKKELESHWIP